MKAIQVLISAVILASPMAVFAHGDDATYVTNPKSCAAGYAPERVLFRSGYQCVPTIALCRELEKQKVPVLQQPYECKPSNWGTP